MSSGHFQTDLEQGEKLEIMIREYLNKNTPVRFSKVEGKFKAFDLFACLEVKDQKESRIAFFFEISSEGKPSGLVTTKAQVWAVADATSIYFIDIDTLRRIVKEQKLKTRTHKVYNTTGYMEQEGYVVYKSTLLNYGVETIPRN